MRYKAVFVAGAAAGYLLGTRAGRERYHAMRRLGRRVAENPTAQEVAGVLQAQASDYADIARTKMGARRPVAGPSVTETLDHHLENTRKHERTNPRSRL